MAVTAVAEAAEELAAVAVTTVAEAAEELAAVAVTILGIENTCKKYANGLVGWKQKDQIGLFFNHGADTSAIKQLMQP